MKILNCYYVQLHKIILFSVLSLIFSAGKVSSQTAEEFFEMGFDSYFDRNFEDAISYFSRAIQIKPDYTEAYLYRGEARSDYGRYSDALADFDKVIKLDSVNFDAYFQKCITEYRMGNYEEALRDCDRSILMRPPYDMAYYFRAKIKRELQDYEGAISDCNEAIGLMPAFFPYYSERGIYKILAGKKEEGCKDLKKALEMGEDPNSIKQIMDAHCK
ncbi:MAG: tetratricopeptide repeat protein [Ignavibacteriae bacterium]|nr:tetratricopeptide repeat protein [Ignavibacteriota bacterium]